MHFIFRRKFIQHHIFYSMFKLASSVPCIWKQYFQSLGTVITFSSILGKQHIQYCETCKSNKVHMRFIIKLNWVFIILLTHFVPSIILSKIWVVIIISPFCFGNEIFLHLWMLITDHGVITLVHLQSLVSPLLPACFPNLPCMFLQRGWWKK